MPGSSGRLQGPKAAAAMCAPLLPELEVPVEYTLARATESQRHHFSADLRDKAIISILPTAVPNPISVWHQLKLAAITSGDYEAAEVIDVLLSGSREPEYGTTEAYPVIRGSGKAPDNYTPFQWPALSQLSQFVAKYSLGSPAVVNILWFLTTEEINSLPN